MSTIEKRITILYGSSEKNRADKVSGFINLYLSNLFPRIRLVNDYFGFSGINVIFLTY